MENENTIPSEALLLKRVAEDLRRVIADSGLKQSEISEKLGFRGAEVSARLTGTRNLTLKSIHEICELLDVEVVVTLVKRRGRPQAARRIGAVQ
jgi:transcriptional regulator with XRE-family HTH domain